ncbi:hypothetical protein [Streptomyces goshikiensis]|uniref:hypothetical protein n=1 Tax=Streptomyces goshikiensis TaxID=1942 RepID=UPI00368582C3
MFFDQHDWDEQLDGALRRQAVLHRVPDLLGETLLDRLRRHLGLLRAGAGTSAGGGTQRFVLRRR